MRASRWGFVCLAPLLGSCWGTVGAGTGTGAGARAGAGASVPGVPEGKKGAPAGKAGPVDLGAGRTVGHPIVFRNLALFPVAAAAAGDDDYLVLDEALPAGLVAVHEKGEGVVSELALENRSARPLFLMAGEILIGGKQDRVIGKNTIIAAHTTTTVPVKCVERGRWSGRKADFESAGVLAHLELRKKAAFSDQPEVWAEVKAKAELRKAETATGTYGAVAAAGKLDAGIEAYAAHFEAAWHALAARERVVGFVVALNGEVAAVELFAAAPLFAKLRAKLMRSYYVEAVDHPVLVERAPDAAKVGAFAKSAKDAAKGATRVTKGAGSSTFDFAEGDFVGSTVRAPVKPKPGKASKKGKGAAGSGADDEAVFESYHAH